MSIKSVLFCCDFNASRSVIAESIMKDWYDNTLEVASAGVSCDEIVNGFAIAVMKEIHINIQNHEPRLIKRLEYTPFDLVVTLTENSNLAIQNLNWSQKTTLEHWDIPSPINPNLGYQQQLEAFRKTRDALIKLILVRFPLPLKKDDPEHLHNYLGGLD